MKLKHFVIKELYENQIVWPIDTVKSIEKLGRATFSDHWNLFLVIWGIELEEFEKLYTKTEDNEELRKELKKLDEEYDFLQLS